ncbi:MAG: radical SAM protein [Micrococcales bacterium]|nr:radical SAM protein [Micrococcales bacterium]
MTSSHVLRQETNCGFWFIRDEGRAFEVNVDTYAVLAALVRGRGHVRKEGHRFTAGATALPQDLTAALQRHGLTPGATPGWDTVRLIPLPPNPPTDAAVAPKRIYFEITRACNLACRHCFNNSHFPLPHELSLDEILDVNRQAEEMGVFEIRYTGGECTRHPDFRAIVDDARRRGLYVSIGTNGVYSPEQLEWLPTSGVDWFIISLDGDRDTNDAIRGRGSYDAVMTTLAALATHPHLRVRLNMVVARNNVATIADVAQVAADTGVASLNLIPLRPYGRATRHMTQAMFSKADFYAFISEVNRLRVLHPHVDFSTTIDLLDPTKTTSHDRLVRKHRTCAAGIEACVVGPLGHVYGCSYSPASFPDTIDETSAAFIAGSLRDDPLATIWSESARWRAFRDLEEFKHPKCLTCRHYTIRCSGSCQIMAYYEQTKAADPDSPLSAFCDPYCFADLLDEAWPSPEGDGR